MPRCMSELTMSNAGPHVRHQELQTKLGDTVPHLVAHGLAPLGRKIAINIS